MDHKAYAKPGHLISGVSFVKTILKHKVCTKHSHTTDPSVCVCDWWHSTKFCAAPHVSVAACMKGFDSASIEDNGGKVVNNHQAVWQNGT